MSASSTTKNKAAAKDKVSLMKLTKSNILSNDMQTFKISLGEFVGDYDPKLKTVYQDAIPSKIRLPKDDERMHCPVIILVLEAVHKQSVKAINWRNFSLSGDVFPVFLAFCEKYITLNSLRLEDAGLQEADITVLGQFLGSNPNITELNLSGNPYQKNFNGLLRDTKLKYLTLKFCKMNHEDLRHLVEPLKNAYQHSLLHLNLSNNNIGDQGAIEIAEILRINRILVSVNLSSNYITNDGVKKILEALQMFYLNQEEISRRRKIYYQYYLKKYEQMKMASPSAFTSDEAQTLTSKSSSNSAMRMKGKRSSKQRSMKRKQSKSATSLVENEKSSSRDRGLTSAWSLSTVPAIADISDLVATLDFQAAYHPFVKETVLEGFEFVCRGNFVLMHLNISFNSLTPDILYDIHDMLHYQMLNGSTEEGLKSINTYGNNLRSETSEQLQQEISDILAVKTVRTGSLGTIITNKEAAPRRERKRSKN